VGKELESIHDALTKMERKEEEARPHTRTAPQPENDDVSITHGLATTVGKIQPSCKPEKMIDSNFPRRWF
jgi:hypothetical protein